MLLLFILKISCLCCLLAIIVQDFKERKVYTWLLIGASILMSLFYFLNSHMTPFFINIGTNLSVALLIVGILYLYAKLKLKQPLHKVLGLGDILFFIGIAISFPMATFLVLFSCSLGFSLIVFLVVKSSLKEKNVPLAGLQALFFLLIFSFNWIFHFTNLYAF